MNNFEEIWNKLKEEYKNIELKNKNLKGKYRLKSIYIRRIIISVLCAIVYILSLFLIIYFNPTNIYLYIILFTLLDLGLFTFLTIKLENTTPWEEEVEYTQNKLTELLFKLLNENIIFYVPETEEAEYKNVYENWFLSKANNTEKFIAKKEYNHNNIVISHVSLTDEIEYSRYSFIGFHAILPYETKLSDIGYIYAKPYFLSSSNYGISKKEKNINFSDGKTDIFGSIPIDNIEEFTIYNLIKPIMQEYTTKFEDKISFCFLKDKILIRFDDYSNFNVYKMDKNKKYFEKLYFIYNSITKILNDLEQH